MRCKKLSVSKKEENKWTRCDSFNASNPRLIWELDCNGEASWIIEVIKNYKSIYILRNQLRISTHQQNKASHSIWIKILKSVLEINSINYRKLMWVLFLLTIWMVSSRAHLQHPWGIELQTFFKLIFSMLKAFFRKVQLWSCLWTRTNSKHS